MPSGDELEVELPIYSTGKEITDELLNAEVAPRVGPEGNPYIYDLVLRDGGIFKRISSNNTLWDYQVSSGDLFFFSPRLVPGHETKLIIKLFPSGEEYDVKLPLNTTSKELLATLAESDIINTNEKKYRLLSKSNGKEFKYDDLLFDGNLFSEDTLIVVSSNEETNKLFTIKDKIGNLPNEVIKTSVSFIEEYIKRIEEGSLYHKPQSLDECKLIFIGSGEVGKTSLINRLVKNKFNEKQNKTDGIEITKWEIQKSKKSINLNIWDFGGQEIMHATHKFFMTRRSVYILVINPRIQDQYAGDAELDYWLKLIESFASSSPIIIVTNKCDTHKIDIAKGALSDKYPQIVGFIETSCKLNIGIDELKKLIKRAISKLKHLDDIIPVSYLKVKEKLENINKEYLHYPEYVQLCKEIDPQLSDSDLEIIVRLLNDLGIMLNVVENRRLSETQVLNPEWITNGVYTIINSKKIIENKGLINEDEVAEILDSSLYPTTKERGFIMDMMNHFELCYQVPEKDFYYFIPGAFPKDKPNEIKWNYENYLHFQLKYDILPSSIMSRFLVKIHHYIHQKSYWRHGAVIKDNNTIAFVEALPFEKKIIIKVAGRGDKKNFLSFIRKEFDIIHRSISKLLVEPFIALDASGGILVNYDDLLSYNEAGENIYFEPKTRKRYNVKDLLNGIEKRINFELIINNISKGKSREALEELNNNFPNQNEIVLLLAQINQLIKDKASGILNSTQVNQEFNKINSSTLEIIDRLKRENHHY